jgi:membrane protease YdiL (CAAX protease family)
VKNRQAEIVQEMSDRQILYHLYLTQIILFFVTIMLGFFLFDSWKSFSSLWNLDDLNILYYGGGSATIVIGIDFILMKFIPKNLYDDGGINEKVFQTRTIAHILFLTVLIAFVEEMLFRGVLQTNIGLILASLLFALLHTRYLAKWVLFTSVVLLSFLLGVIYEITGNIWITIFSHFLIDFVSAVKIRTDFLKKIGGV